MPQRDLKDKNLGEQYQKDQKEFPISDEFTRVLQTTHALGRPAFLDLRESAGQTQGHSTLIRQKGLGQAVKNTKKIPIGIIDSLSQPAGEEELVYTPKGNIYPQQGFNQWATNAIHQKPNPKYSVQNNFASAGIPFTQEEANRIAKEIISINQRAERPIQQGDLEWFMGKHATQAQAHQDQKNIHKKQKY